MMRWAAHLYQSGQIARLKRLWVELAAETSYRTQPDARQLDWAVARMPRMIAKWETNDNPFLPNWADIPDPAGYATIGGYLKAYRAGES